MYHEKLRLVPIIFSVLGISGLMTRIHRSCGHLVWRKCYDKIRLGLGGGEFVKDRQFPDMKKYMYHQVLATRQLQIVKEPQNALLLLVVQTQSFPQEPILLYSTGLINKVQRTPLLVQASWVGLCRKVCCYCLSYLSVCLVGCQIFVC